MRSRSWAGKARAMEKERFLELLADGLLPLDQIVSVVTEVEPSGREEALGALLPVLERQWKSEGAWEALRHLPPFLLNGAVEGDARGLMELIFPFDAHSVSPRLRTGEPVDFWDWQAGHARSVEGSQRPTGPVAREKWLRKCARDPAWEEAVRVVGEAYSTYVRFLATAPRRDGEFRLGRERMSEAFRGRPDCGHVENRAQCGRCTTWIYEAWEAHIGWMVEADWAPPSERRVVRWIESDGQLRTRDELLAEVMRELRFKRRGSRIVEAIERAIAAERSQGPQK